MAEKKQIDNYALPDAATLEAAGELMIYREDGHELPFRDLYTNTSTENGGKQLIVYIRHFFCGHCEDYVRALSSAFPPSSLPANITISIIGCGQPSLIASYRQRTSCPFPIYADPSRALYAKLGMTQNLALGEKSPEYIKSGILGGTLSSMWTMLKNVGDIPKGGNYSQNGGEWVFEGGKLKWCHRMEDTRGHAEVKDLREVLGLGGK